MAVTTTLNLRTVLEFFLEKAERLLPYSVFNIKLWNDQLKILEPVICRNMDEKEWKTEIGKSSAGLTHIPFETKQPFSVARIETESRAGRPDFARKHGLVSYLGLPLNVRGKVLGVLSFYTREKHDFDHEEIEFFSTLASQVAFAIHNAKLYEQAQQTLSRLHALHEIHAATTELLDVRSVLDVLLNKIALLLPYAAVTVRLFNKQTGKLEATACWNIDEKEWMSEEANPPSGFASAVFEKKAPIFFRNIQTDPIIWQHDLFRRHGLVSCLGVPLISKEEILGTITFYTKEEREFGDEEIEFLSTLASLAGIAIQKSWLYEQAKNNERELEKANRVKDEFLGVVSHELRTPLNVVMGYAGIIKDRLFGDVNTQQEEALGKILARTNDQLTLVNNILYATALETTGLRGQTYPLSVGDFFDQLKEVYHFPLGKEVTLSWSVPPRGLIISTDPDKLKHVLHNLIDNAIKFTERGSVTITSKVLPATRELEIRVADTGIGMAEEQVPLIFEKFRQGDSSQTRLYGGVGLGLYIVKKFTEVLGGKVGVESVASKGSTFTVTIPCEK